MSKDVTRSHARAQDLGERVRELRRRAGVTQQQVAEAMDVTREAISQLERRGDAAWASRVLALANVLGCHPGELFGDAQGLSTEEEHILKMLRALPREQRDGVAYLLHTMTSVPWAGRDRRRNGNRKFRVA